MVNPWRYIPGLLPTLATNKYQVSKTSIVHLTGPCYLTRNISPQQEIIEYMSLHLIESSVLTVTKVKFSSLIWKIRHFKKQFLVSVSPIA